jgi:hypothetical protein
MLNLEQLMDKLDAISTALGLNWKSGKGKMHQIDLFSFFFASLFV